VTRADSITGENSPLQSFIVQFSGPRMDGRVALEVLLSLRTRQPIMMQRPVLRLIFAVGLPIAAALLLEQMPKTGVAEVPFAFQVEDQVLPAGTYSIRETDFGRSLRIRNERLPDLGAECVVVRHRFGKSRGSRVVFQSQGRRYYLSEVWFDADGAGLVLNQRSQERKVASTPPTRPARFVRFQ
jgi:hypothetical protein